MFVESSRYFGVPTIVTAGADGKPVVALKLRPLAAPLASSPYVVAAGDRLDVIASARLGDATAFWRIADTNSELDVSELGRDPGAEIQVPVR